MGGTSRISINKIETEKTVPTLVIANNIANALVVWETVQDQLTHVVGRQAAIWIRMALEWML